MLASPLVVGVTAFLYTFSFQSTAHIWLKCSLSREPLNPWLLLLQAAVPIFEVLVTVETLKHLFGLCDCDMRLTQTSGIMSTAVSPTHVDDYLVRVVPTTSKQGC